MKKNVIEFVIQNGLTFITLTIAAIALAILIGKFLRLSKDNQKEKVKECLLGWVVAAEKELGGKTGDVKLSMVYGWFVKAFPFIKNFVSFQMFKFWVDEILGELNEMLKDNKELENTINGHILEVGVCEALKESLVNEGEIPSSE